jgi:hypothetical protein
MFLSTLMRRAVPMPQHRPRLADDPSDNRARVAFLGALPFDEHGSAVGGEGEAGFFEAVEELTGLPLELGLEFFRVEGGGFDAKARQVVPKAFRDVHRLAVPGEVEAGEQGGGGGEHGWESLLVFSFPCSGKRSLIGRGTRCRFVIATISHGQPSPVDPSGRSLSTASRERVGWHLG